MTPKTEQELAEAIAAAKGPLRITGGGTRDIGNPVLGEALSTSGLSGITLYEPGALTIVARAGTSVAEIEAALDGENQRLAFEPMDHRVLLGTDGTPTIGGIVAGNVSGPRRISVGACRDHMLGVRFVDGAGNVTKNGGRVMKNVTGYDLVKLFSGSYGTLGVMSEVSLKVLPKPATSATLSVAAEGNLAAVQAMSAALGSPYEVTGAAMDRDGAVHLRLEGFEASVAYRLGKLREVVAPLGDITTQTDRTKSEAQWKAMGDVAQFADAPALWRVSLRPSDAPEVIEALGQSHEFDYSLDWGGGLIWIAARDDDPSRAVALHGAAQAEAMRLGGHATLIKGPAALRGAVPVFQPENATVTALSHGLRARFDPRGILNAGLMG